MTDFRTECRLCRHINKDDITGLLARFWESAELRREEVQSTLISLAIQNGTDCSKAGMGLGGRDAHVRIVAMPYRRSRDEMIKAFVAGDRNIFHWLRFVITIRCPACETELKRARRVPMAGYG